MQTEVLCVHEFREREGMQDLAAHTEPRCLAGHGELPSSPTPLLAQGLLSHAFICGGEIPPDAQQQ